ncbi:MAG: hypothetical protein R3F24_10845 [Gammaproteobacteria bacterium]
MWTTVALKRSRWQLMLAALLLFAAQLVVDSHLIGHTASGDNAGCVICAISGGSPGAPPAVVNLAPAASPLPAPVIEQISAPVSPRVVATNQARAPPHSV